MKFQQLPLGARFEFEGRVYVKVGPMAASAEDGGGQRLIPRWAVLKPLDGAAGATPKRPARQLDEAAVTAAFEAYHAACARLLDEACTDVDRGMALRTGLARARGRFLQALEQARCG